MKLIVAGTVAAARQKARDCGLSEGRGVRLVTPSTANYLRGREWREGDELIIGHFDPVSSRAEQQRRDGMWESLQIGGWVK